MKKKTLLLISLIILVFFMSGCLAKKIPSEITGPTMATKYRIPLIKRTLDEKTGESKSELRLGAKPNGLGEAGLDLSGEVTNLSFSADSEEFNLLREPATIQPESIANCFISPLNPGENYSIPDGKKVTLTLPDTFDYSSVTFSDHPNNTIDINLDKATAGSGGVIFTLEDGTKTLQTAIMEPGMNSCQLNLAGKVFDTPTLSIKITGTLLPSATEATFSFTPNNLEVESFTIPSDLLDTKIDPNFSTIDYSIRLPEFNDFELSTAGFTIESQLPENITLQVDLTIQGEDDNGQGVGHEIYKTITLQNANPGILQLANEINNILNEKPSNLRIQIYNFSIKATDDVTLSYPGTIALDYSLELGLGSLTTSPQKINIGNIETPEGFFQSAQLCFKLKNTSPLGLTIQVSLSPMSNPLDDPLAVTKELLIAPNSDWTPLKIEIIAQELSRLTKSDTIYHQILIKNTSEGGEITDDDYLEIKAWAEAQCLINKR
jgi:hypothetical protein